MTPIKIPARFDDFASGYLSQLDTAVNAAVKAWEKAGIGPAKFRELARAALDRGDFFNAYRNESLAAQWERDPRIPVAHDLLGATEMSGKDGTCRYFLSQYLKLVEGVAS